MSDTPQAFVDRLREEGDRVVDFLITFLESNGEALSIKLNTIGTYINC
jgi:hypothetical protein